MIIYRPQRGSLSESMREARLFADEDSMKSHIVREFDGVIDFGDIVIVGGPVNDDRIEWRDTRCVCVKAIPGERCETPLCVGFCSFNF